MLRDLDGLDGIEIIGGGLFIYNNSGLESLHGVHNVRSVGQLGEVQMPQGGTLTEFGECGFVAETGFLLHYCAENQNCYRIGAEDSQQYICEYAPPPPSPPPPTSSPNTAPPPSNPPHPASFMSHLPMPPHLPTTSLPPPTIAPHPTPPCPPHPARHFSSAIPPPPGPPGRCPASHRGAATQEKARPYTYEYFLRNGEKEWETDGEAVAQMCDELVAQFAVNMRDACWSSTECTSECFQITSDLLSHRCFKNLGEDEGGIFKYRILDENKAGNAERVRKILDKHGLEGREDVLRWTQEYGLRCFGYGSACYRSMSRNFINVWESCNLQYLRSYSYHVDMFYQNATYTCNDDCLRMVDILTSDSCYVPMYTYPRVLYTSDSADSRLFSLDEIARSEFISEDFETQDDADFWEFHSVPHMHVFTDEGVVNKREWTPRDLQYNVFIALNDLAYILEKVYGECFYRFSGFDDPDCDSMTLERLGFIYDDCSRADMRGGAHADRCPTACSVAINAAKDDLYDSERQLCYAMRAIISVPYNPNNLIYAVDKAAMLGCRVQQVVSTYDNMGQPYQEATYEAGCTCSELCQEFKYPENTFESFLNASYQMTAWNRHEVLCSAPWYERDGPFVSSECVIYDNDACPGDDELSGGAIVGVVLGVLIPAAALLGAWWYYKRKHQARCSLGFCHFVCDLGCTFPSGWIRLQHREPLVR
ncbi:hypothetical protein CYMTET_51571 [Cymbomonas tetramitiformis]|uniref:Uncharacterized protein n=1 Tax=Cymbomonas tetramitiformis TaxID=36881 RepID=A0AAE0BM08_9CHLO|nr:hypothetical protein CYMTET_51571 [Cymbomonas tetramitiformis]